MNQTSRKAILELIKKGEISPEDGLLLIKELKRKEEAEAGTGVKIRCTSQEGKNLLDIAVIGISMRYPGADNKEKFWENLKNSVGSITPVPQERWEIDSFFDSDPAVKDKTYCKMGGYINDIDKFDPLFFNISPKEAELMDPQQRIFMEEAWKAIEDAGYSDKALWGTKCGIFVGASQGDYAKYLAAMGYQNSADALTGVAPSILAARLSYFLNLTGPSIALETACSSSLVAIHQACMSIRNNESEMAIAGGVVLMLTPELHIRASKMGMLSPDGKCRAFDEDANGTVFSEGAGVVVLKPLLKALEDGNHIYGVIKASGINQDGKTNGITAPSAKSQTSLLLDVYRGAGINPAEIGYIETHGTGTKLGDPIEIKALTNAFRNYTQKKQFCAVGSVKTNIGHASIAAGAASFIKTLLMLEKREIPASLNYIKPNSQINFEDSPFFVNTDMVEWHQNGANKRKAAISSFGFSGTNCHMVVEEAPDHANKCHAVEMPYWFIPISAKTLEALNIKIRELLEWLNSYGSSYSLGNISYTLSVGRSHFPVRYSFWVKDLASLKRELSNAADNGIYIKNSPGAVDEDINNNGLLDFLSRYENYTQKDIDLKLKELSDLYMAGYDIELQRLYQSQNHIRIPMPTYPFARNRCWISPNLDITTIKGEVHKLLDTVDYRKSVNEGIVFIKDVKSSHCYVKGCKLLDKKYLPSSVLVEMAFEAVLKVTGESFFTIREVRFEEPITLDDGNIKLEIRIKFSEENVLFNFYKFDESNVISGGEIILNLNRSQNDESKKVKIKDIINRCGNYVDEAGVYKSINETGQKYGAYYSSIKGYWSNEHEALAQISVPSGYDRDSNDYLICPSLFEALFQTICLYMRDNALGNKDIIFAQNMKGIAHLKQPGKNGYVYIRNSSTSGFSAAFFNTDGSLCIKIEDIRMKTFTPLQNIDAHSMENALKEALLQIPGPFSQEHKKRNYQEAFEKLKDLYSLLLMQAFQRMGVFIKLGEEYKVNRLREKMNIIPAYSRLFNRLTDVLKIAGFIKLVDGNISCTKETKIDDEALARNKEEIIKFYPFIKQYVDLVWTCIKNYPELLTGRANPTDVIFPNSGMELVEGIYKGNEIIDYYNDIVLSAVISYIRECVFHIGTGRKIKILEVGAGTGGTSTAVFEGLGGMEDIVEYYYTDISPAFINYGRRIFGLGNLNIVFKVLNIEGDIEAQGFVPGDFDLVLATNVLHATKSMKKTLGNVSRLLKPRGWLIVNEATGDNIFATLTFGLLEGWWLFEDEDKRIKGSPLMEPGMWNDILKNSGFDTVLISQDGGNDMTDIAQNVIVARNGSNYEKIMQAEGVCNKPLIEEQPVKTDEFIGISALSERCGTELNEEDKKSYLESCIVECICDILHLEESSVSQKLPFTDYGVDSISSVDIINQINKKLSVNLRATDLFNYSDIESLRNYIFDKFSDMIEYPSSEGRRDVLEIFSENFVENSQDDLIQGNDDFEYKDSDCISSINHDDISSDIAIIGVSGCFPEADDIDQLWDNLKNGRDLVKEITRWDLSEFYDPDPKKTGKSYSKWGGLLEDIESFDALFFNISAKEAQLMDPQHRIFLVEAWKALENSGYTDKSLDGMKCGVFVGCGSGDYSKEIEKAEVLSDAYSFLGNIPSVLSARLSYFLNLKGACLAVDTACSSSLLAVHLACESIWSGSSEIAVAGGVTILSTPAFYICTSGAGMLSPTGRCRSFDNDADGFVPGEGAGAVVLKSLNAALRDGDNIYGVICGTGTNYDGKTNGITAPNGPSQTALECEVYNKYKINPEKIGYIEAHGSGTKLGDPLEFDAITDAFRYYTNKKQFCAIGSIKSNIGHSLAAAGIAGMIKALLCIKNKQLVPAVNFRKENEHIQFKDSPFYVNSELKEWTTENNSPRYAAISSFGVSGTNVHVVIREAVEFESIVRENDLPREQLAVVSAKSPKALIEKIVKLEQWLKTEGVGKRFCDICYTLVARRSHYQYRIALTAQNTYELAEKLSAYMAQYDEKEFVQMVRIANKTKKDPVLKQQGENIIDELANGNLNEEGYNEKVEKLAELYRNGYDLDWRRMYSEGSYINVPLPGYPFEKEAFWVKGRTAVSSVKAVDQARGSETRLSVLKKIYREDCQEVMVNSIPQSRFIILVNQYSSILARAINGGFDGAEHIWVENKLVLEKLSNNSYSMSFTDPQQGRQVFEFIGNIDQFTGILDLSDVYEQPVEYINPCYGKIALVQEILKQKMREPFTLLHFTRGLNNFKTGTTTLAGADFAGFPKVLGTEYSWLKAKTIDVDLNMDNRERWQKIIQFETVYDGVESEICYRENKRYVPVIEDITRESEFVPGYFGGIEPKPEKVYVVTGGTRGLGALAARHLVSKGARKLVIMGACPLPDRSKWNEIMDQGPGNLLYNRIKNIMDIEAMGIKLEVYSGSLSDEKSMENFFSDIRSGMGSIGGIIHCAGLSIDENPAFVNKRIDDIKKVFEPKMEGLQKLFRIIDKDLPEFFILYSSVSAVLPVLSTGITDYSTANMFMDYFAAYCHGKGSTFIKSVNWSSWKETGMGEVKSPAYYQLGLVSHTDNEGLSMLENIMGRNTGPNVFTCMVDHDYFRTENLLIKEKKASTLVKTAGQAAAEEHRTALVESGLLNQWVKKLFAEELKFAEDRLEEDVPFGDYGVDSIMLAELVKKIENKLTIKLDPSIFIEYPTINLLSEYIFKNYTDEINRKIGTVEGSTLESTGVSSVQEPLNIETVSESYKAYVSDSSPQYGGGNVAGKIAVIGVACHFPGAENKEQFWNNLKDGKSSIREVPESRWDSNLYYSPFYQEGKTISKWGGFIDGIEYFDAEYFKISQEDAPFIDPLIRQFFEISVKTFNDAGYEKKELWNKKIGVFVGARTGGYSSRFDKFSKNSIIGIGQNFIAAHVSHYFNLKGVNMVVDTACSSSLVSLHLACRSLMAGECEMALAGGVDILLDEKSYIMLSEAKALSPDGKCHTFDEKANGFVPGEGCGAVLLKPLDRALKDGDAIYAVIDSSALNNDGHTMGITTPNPEAQSSVIRDAIQNGGIDPETITYVEAHGTGTMIGDPIELKALTSVFKEFTCKKQFCSVGSVKTNIGHLLSAAGIASFIKVVLSLKNGFIPPTLNCEAPNPRFKFNQSPFFPNISLREWKPVNGLRRAGISSFGFGGTNAHVILSDFTLPYEIKRRPLPSTLFNRKRFWIDDMKDESVSKVIEDDEKEFLDMLDIKKVY